MSKEPQTAPQLMEPASLHGETVLVLAPHPDDEAIGCGGSICLQRGRGRRVVVVFLTSGEAAFAARPPEEVWRFREAEALCAARLMDVNHVVFLRLPDSRLSTLLTRAADALRPTLQLESPTYVYLPHPAEAHPDHQATYPILSRAYDGSELRRPFLRAYEVWTPVQTYDDIADISSVAHTKLRAIRCYRSQLSAFRYDRAIKGLNAYRGELGAKCRYAEVFQCPEL